MRSNRKITFQVRGNGRSMRNTHPKLQYPIQNIFRIRDKSEYELPKLRRRLLYDGEHNAPYKSKIKPCGDDGNDKYYRYRERNRRYSSFDRLTTSMAEKCVINDMKDKHNDGFSVPKLDSTVSSSSSSEESSITTSEENSPTNMLALRCKSKLSSAMPQLADNIKIVCLKAEQLQAADRIHSKALVILLFTGCWDSKTCRTFEQYLIKKCSRHRCDLELFVIDICSANWLTSLHCITTVPSVEIWRRGKQLFRQEGVYNGKASDVLRKIRAVITYNML